MKKLILFAIVLATPALHSQQGLTFFDYDTLDINNIFMRPTNVGNCEYAFWKVLSGDVGNQFIIYDHGPWIIGKAGSDTVLSYTQWFYNSYSPGPIINGQPAMQIHPEDSLKYRVYKLSKGDDSTNIDYAEWPVEFGAPVDEQGKPLLLGDQTLWTVFNSLDSTAIASWTNNPVKPFPIEIRQTAFARNRNGTDEQDIFANTVFMEWEIINKSNQQIDSAFFGFWSDIDFEDMYDNRPGVDSIRQLGYCWTSEPQTYFDSIPPAVGYTMLYGPVVPSTGNTATFKGRQISDYKNLHLNSFRGISDDSALDSLYSPARSIKDAWNIARGFDSRGNVILDPTTNNPTSFPLSGDPITGQGWVYNNTWGTGGGAGFMFFSGPFTFAPSDTQWTMIALVPGRGVSNLNSITQMRYKADMLRSIPYDSIAFGILSYPITDVEVNHFPAHPADYELFQNYPNPFNPVTKISYSLPVTAIVDLKVYNILGQLITTLVNEEKPAGIYEVDFNAANLPDRKSSLPSGMYIYQLRIENLFISKKMILIK